MSDGFRKPFNVDDERSLFSRMPSKPSLPTSDVHRTTLRSHYKLSSLGSFSRDSLASSISSLTASRENLFSCDFNTLGSSWNLNTSAKMSLLEDVKSHKISAEVMKQRLYESVLTSPSRRRHSTLQHSYYADSPQNFHIVQSLPVTPAASKSTSPLSSPRSSRYFTKRTEEDMCIEEENGLEETRCTGLASVLRPEARFVPTTGKDGESKKIVEFERRLKNYPSNHDLSMSLTDGPSPAKRRTNNLK